MSKINVNTVDTQCGSTLTLGSSGKTVTLASGASQSGFGRTGTVDWCTTAKTSPFTAVNGKGYFINTTSGAVTVTLPASPSAGDIVAFKDYANTFDTNNLTIGGNSSKINGQCANATLNTESQSVTLIYVDGTKGWQDIHDSTSDVTGNDHIEATGGTITTCGDFKIHTFTGDGCFAVSAAPNPAKAKVSYVVVAGGGGAGNWAGGGGGGGGYREGKLSTDPYTASPLAATPCSALPVSVQTYPITVGGGGAGQPAGSTWPTTQACGGSNSVFSTITSTAGGAGGSNDRPSPAGPIMSGHPGGSGGGGGRQPGNVGGAGNTPPVSPPQGNTGGSGIENAPAPRYLGGGGGGATAVGSNAPPAVGGTGGAGATSSINGSPVGRAGGGGGGTTDSGGPSPASDGGGAGGTGGGTNPGTNGTANTGGGGGGAGATNPGSASSGAGGTGGSGVVIIRYKFQ